MNFFCQIAEIVDILLTAITCHQSPKEDPRTSTVLAAYHEPCTLANRDIIGKGFKLLAFPRYL
jgi:hypothetical protein